MIATASASAGFRGFDGAASVSATRASGFSSIPAPGERTGARLALLICTVPVLRDAALARAACAAGGAAGADAALAGAVRDVAATAPVAATAAAGPADGG